MFVLLTRTKNKSLLSSQLYSTIFYISSSGSWWGYWNDRADGVTDHWREQPQQPWERWGGNGCDHESARGGRRPRRPCGLHRLALASALVTCILFTSASTILFINVFFVVINENETNRGAKPLFKMVIKCMRHLYLHSIKMKNEY